MPDLSPAYQEIKELRSRGNCSAAISRLRSTPPGSDRDAFEAAVCLFVCGDLESALTVCRNHAWTEPWASNIAGALSEGLAGGDAARSLSLARQAVGVHAAPYDASAIYLLLLQRNGLVDEADAYIKTRLQNVPPTETFLLTLMAEIAAATGNWREAYRAACAVLAADPDDYRALIVMSILNFDIGNIHESLGHALRANLLRKGSLPAVLQIMRCRNRLGNYYAALAAFETLVEGTVPTAEVHVELGKAYDSLRDFDRAIAEYRAALATGSRSASAVLALIANFASSGRMAELDSLVAEYREEIESDFTCLTWLALAAINRGELDQAEQLFRKTLALTKPSTSALRELPWPVPEPRVRHDYEQLELLARRGRLDRAGREALALLKRYCARETSPEATFAPPGAEGEALKDALMASFNVAEVPFSGPTLGENDFAAIEDTYLAERIVVIDNFLSPEALQVLRRCCEETTVWKLNYERGYLGAVLAQGFNPRVLLQIAHELKQAMPRVIGDSQLSQAWAYKYDQRMQGISLHADFAEVNVNFWITPDEACEDPTTGGMVVYDLPVPDSWTFDEYNNDPKKLAVYLRVHNASFRRVPYRANRCVLFDSRLIHSTDEMHFRPGYENRRVNVTLLYGKARGVD